LELLDAPHHPSASGFSRLVAPVDRLVVLGSDCRDHRLDVHQPSRLSEPKTLDRWESKGVLGERVFLARKTKPIPEHHLRWGMGLSVMAGIGLLPLIYGLWAFNLWATLLGLVMTLGAKLWFIDRMVWLLADATHNSS
jgi:hypothetical protein